MSVPLGFITYGLSRAPGGIGRYTAELLHALREAGVAVTVLEADRGRSGNGVVHLSGARLLPGLLTLGQVEIALAARRHRLPLVHDPTGTMPLLLTRARRVITIHDVVPHIFPATSTWLEALIYRSWLPLMARRIHAVITDSAQSKADIVRHLPLAEKDVHVVPLAANARFRPLKRAQVDPALARHGIQAPYILYVGSIEARKNLTRLLTAFARLVGRSGRHKLVVVGARRWKASAVLAAVQRLQLEPHVHFAGYVADEDLPALYSGADLFVFPSLYEGFGLPVLEAMACGVPVITSNLSALPEVVGDAALQVDPRDSDAIAAAMARVLDDADLSRELRARGLERARLFSWQRAARETIAVYEKALDGG